MYRLPRQHLRYGVHMKQLQLISLVVLFAALAGCSSTSPEEKLAKQQQQNKIFSARVSESEALMEKLTARVNQAKNDNLNYYSPKRLEDALEAYADAKKDFDEIVVDKTEATKSQVADIKENVFEANKELDAAYVVKTNAESILVESFDIRLALKALKAPSLKQFARSYKRLSDDIDDIVEDIADGDLEDARADNGKLLPKLRALEVDVVQYVELSSVRARAASLKKQRASRYVPNAYQKALSALRIAESTIAANARDKAKIAEVVTQSTFELDRASNLLQAVQELSKIKSNARESYITRFENQLLSISKALADKDLRNKTLAQQASLIVELIDGNKSQLDSIQSSAAASNAEADKLVADAQSQAAALKSQLMSKDALLESQVKENASLKALVSELEMKALASDKRILELQKSALELQTKALEQETAPVATQLPAPVSTPVAEAVEEATAESDEPEQADVTPPQS